MPTPRPENVECHPGVVAEGVWGRKSSAVAMSELLRLDAQTRRWLKLEVSRRRKEKELHVGRPVLYRYSEQRDKRTSTSLDGTAFLDEVGA